MRDPRLLTQLFVSHAQEVKRFFRRRLGRAQDAADLNQEVFLRLLRVTDLEGIKDPQGYLFTVAANLLRERSHHERRVRHEAQLPIEQLLNAPELVDDSSVEGEIDKPLLLSRLRSALAQLPSHDRAMLKMVYEERLSYREIGRRLNVSKSAVEKAVGRATARCRKLMEVEGSL